MATAPQPTRPRRRVGRWLRARPRVFVAAAVGIVVAFAIPGIANRSLRTVIGWDVGVVVYLTLLWVMAARATPALMRRRALREGEGGRWAFLVVVAAAAVFSLFAVLGIGGAGKAARGRARVAGIGVAGGTLF